MTLFDHQETEHGLARVAEARSVLDAGAARDDGIARAEDNAPPEWLDEAFAFVRTYLEEHELLHVDDLWDAGLARPPNPRALGAVMKRAARAGLMVATGDYRPSVSSHLSPKPIWRSLVFKGES